MKGNDILALAKAGFTLDQIVQINDVLQLPDETVEPAPAEQPAADGSAAAEAIDNANTRLQETLEKIQKANIARTEQPATEVETTDSIIANIIKGQPLPGKEA